MIFTLPSSRWGVHLLLSLVACASFCQPASAQTRPTSEVLRARQKSATTVKIKSKTTALATSNPRLDSELQRLLANAGGNGQESLTTSQLRASFPELSFGEQAGQPTVLVRITAKDVAALLPKLHGRGFETVSSYPKLHFVEGMLPVSQLAATTALSSSGLLGILASLKPETDGGLVTSQADYVLEAARARATRPKQVMGAGVTIGVLSDSFNSLGGAAADVASGDLPAAGVRVLQEGPATGADEGRAMCQLIYDLAPGSPLIFSTAYNTEGAFAQHIRDLANPALGNCKVIVDDVRYFEEPFFQDGVIAQAVTDVVTNHGVAYFASNGNYADKSYENTAPQFVANANGVRCLNFDGSGLSTDLTQRVTIVNRDTFYPILQWSDPFYTSGGVRTDLNIFLLAVRPNGAVDTVYRANTRNLLTQAPVESILFSNSTATTGTTTFDLVVVWKSGIMPTRLKYVNRGGGTPSEWLTSSSTSYGHSSAGEAFAVAAAPYFNQRVPESLTSKAGPITYLFSPTGAPLSAPIIRQKPNITTVDDTNTTFFGSDSDGDGFPNFAGTSAAAPHAAAVAALLRSSEPTLTPAQVYSRMMASARLIGMSVTDPYTGPGLLDAFTTLYGPVVKAAPPVAEDFEKGALPVSWQLDGYTSARAQVLTLAPASGIQSLVLDAYPRAGLSLNEATLFLQVNAAQAADLQLTFRERKFTAETDEAMPVQFTNQSTTDGVALSVNGGTTWYRVVDLTGPNATTSYQNKSVDLTAFAAANSLTLGNDVRIKFQQYGRGAVSATNPVGRAFDDIVLGSRNPAPAPLYVYTQPTVGCPGLQVQYADTSLFQPTAWSWTFPGGTPGTSNLRIPPLVTYNTAGHHSVMLSVSNAAGTVARTDTGMVFVLGRAPAMAVTSSNPLICRGGTVTFGSSAQDCPDTYAWSFPGGTPSSSGALNPRGIIYNTPGTYTATLTVSNAYGSTTRSIVVEVDGTLATSFVETFNAAPTLPRGWTPVSPIPAYPWTLVDGVVARLGPAGRALRAPFAEDPIVGDHPAIYSVPINLGYAGATAPLLRFELAYRPYASVAGAPTLTNDSLTVLIADACTGAILGRPYAQSALTTLPTGPSIATRFVPTSPADWRREAVNLTPYIGRKVIIRFVGRNGRGNALYLDNVQVNDALISSTISTANAVGFDAWPNPTPSGTALHLRLPAFAGKVSLRLVDAVGRVVWQEQVQQTGAALDRTWHPSVAPGLYALLYAPAGGATAARHIVLE